MRLVSCIWVPFFFFHSSQFGLSSPCLEYGICPVAGMDQKTTNTSEKKIWLKTHIYIWGAGRVLPLESFSDGDIASGRLFLFLFPFLFVVTWQL